MATRKTETERLADALVAGLPVERGKVHDQYSYNLRRDGRRVAEVLARKSRLRLNLVTALPARSPHRKLVTPTRSAGTFAAYAYVTEDNLAQVRALLEELAS